MATTATVRPPRSSNPFPTVNCRVTVASGPRKGQQCGKACGPEGLRAGYAACGSHAHRAAEAHKLSGASQALVAAWLAPEQRQSAAKPDAAAQRGLIRRLQSALLSARRQRRTHVVRGLNRQLDAARTRLGMLSGPRVLEAAYI